jgi:ELWxxDGT repeat protein
MRQVAPSELLGDNALGGNLDRHKASKVNSMGFAMGWRVRVVSSSAVLAAVAWTSPAHALVPQLLRDINPGVADSFASDFVPLTSAAENKDFVYFRADDGVHGFELWRSDGTTAGTQLVMDQRPGPANGFPTNLAAVQGRLYFSAFDTPDAVGSKVFVSDGTAAGTSLLVDTWPTMQPSFFGPPLPGTFTAHGTSNVIFTATGEDEGVELWRTDGTTSGTARVKDIHPGQESSIPIGLTDLDGVVIFAADDSFVESGGFRTYDRELWRTDGTEAGAYRIADINPGPAPSIPVDFKRFGSQVYFRANDGVHDSELWKTDGTAAGTKLVADINPSGPSDLQDLTILGNSLVFFANDGASGYELFRSNGEASGTELLKDINPTGDSSPFNLTVWGDRLFFTADDGVNGRELWVSDGTESGTQMLVNLNGAERSSPDLLTIVGNRLFFTTIVPNDAEGTVQTELWMTDGTPDGAELVFREPGNSFGYAITNLIALGDTLLFTAPSEVDEFGYSINSELYSVTVPEPATLGLALAGILLVTARRLVRRRKS